MQYFKDLHTKAQYDRAIVGGGIAGAYYGYVVLGFGVHVFEILHLRVALRAATQLGSHRGRHGDSTEVPSLEAYSR